METKTKKNRTKEIIIALGGLLLVIGLVAFVDNKTTGQRCKELKIGLLETNKQFYISETDIRNYITENGQKPMIGKSLKDINLGELEVKVKEIKQVEFCEAFADLQGNIHVKVKPYVPFARVIATNGTDQYIDEKGQYFPLSKYYTARVRVLSGTFFNKKPNLKAKQAAYLELLHYLNEDEFCNAQVAQVDVSADGQVRLVPLLGNQTIEFGKPEAIAEKMNKMKVFYRQIMPVKGWHKFSKVKLQYKNQIVCE